MFLNDSSPVTTGRIWGRTTGSNPSRIHPLAVAVGGDFDVSATRK